MTDPRTDLDHLGDVIERAAARDLAAPARRLPPGAAASPAAAWP